MTRVKIFFHFPTADGHSTSEDWEVFVSTAPSSKEIDRRGPRASIGPSDSPSAYLTRHMMVITIEDRQHLNNYQPLVTVHFLIFFFKSDVPCPSLSSFTFFCFVSLFVLTSFPPFFTLFQLESQDGQLFFFRSRVLRGAALHCAAVGYPVYTLLHAKFSTNTFSQNIYQIQMFRHTIRHIAV